MNDIPDGQPCVCSQHLDVSRLEAEVEGLRNPWQPIETAPEDVYIFAWNPDDGYAQVVWIEGGEVRVWLGSGAEEQGFTHWMPLPEPPEES